MVTLRCGLIVTQELEKLGVIHSDVIVGSVVLPDHLKATTQKLLHKNLKRYGMVLLSHTQSETIEELKEAVRALVSDTQLKGMKNEGGYIKAKIKSDYGSASALFAEVMGISLEQYTLIQKLEEVKIWLLYSELNIQDIANKFNFRTREILRRHFKKMTGIAPIFYRQLKEKRHRELPSGSASESIHNHTCRE